MLKLRNLLTSAFCFLLLDVSAAVAQSDKTVEALNEIAETALGNRLQLDFDGTTFSGPAWEQLVKEGEDAQFFIIGEEHGIAENPLLAAQLFDALSGSGYEHLVIEISPAMAFELDRILREDGLEGLRKLYAQRGGEPAFFGMEEEATLLAVARATSNRKKPVLFGVDYEVGSDPILLQLLTQKRKPEAAAKALDALVAASDAAWAQYYETSGPQFIFSFSGDPDLVRAVEAAWPGRDKEAAWILDTLEETLEINKLWVGGEAWQSNARRAAFIRSNFLRHWRDLAKKGSGPKMMIKLGGSHVVRGRTMVETFDLGALLPEIAAINGERSLSVMVLPGADSMTAVLDPVTWTYGEAPGKDGYTRGMDAITSAAFADAFTLIDLRPIRPLVTPRVAAANENLATKVHGFDMVLVMSGGTAATNFIHEEPARQVE